MQLTSRFTNFSKSQVISYFLKPGAQTWDKTVKRRMNLVGTTHARVITKAD